MKILLPSEEYFSVFFFSFFFFKYVSSKDRGD